MQLENPAKIASDIFPLFANFPIISRKNRYYYELILQDTSSCIFAHKFRGNEEAHQISYPDSTCIAYSKIIIYNVISMQEYKNPNTTRRFSNVNLPYGTPCEYWDYMKAWNKVLLYQNNESTFLVC